MEKIMDDRVVNGFNEPYGPILSKTLRDEIESREANDNGGNFDDYCRVTCILEAAADYVEAVVEGKGPDADRIARLEAALRFYAENANYDDGATVYDRVAPVMMDGGEKARHALETK